MSLLTSSTIEQQSIFSKILLGNIDGVILLTTQRFAVIMTNKPVNPGHVLIVPRKQVAHRGDLDFDASSELGKLETFISQVLQNVYTQGMPDSRICSGTLGFEVVDHLHIHYYPTIRGKHLSEAPGKIQEATLSERSVEANKIVMYIRHNLSVEANQLGITLSDSYEKYIT